jgi:mannose-6-phosphate isomerase-like protein (cupin superfamily)
LSLRFAREELEEVSRLTAMEPHAQLVVVQPGPGRKLERPELLVSEIDRRADDRGVAPHFHREHADAFYVLEGEMDFNMHSPDDGFADLLREQS